MSLRSAMLWTLAAALGMSSAACKSITISIPSYTTEPADAPGAFLAGASKTEITPPVGYPLGGHSLGGRVSRGRWLPLYARAFYFQDRQGRSVVMVSCDLFAVPAGLQQRVAALVNECGQKQISRDNLILAATHTHQGPGNFLSSKFYNGFSSPIPGFDSKLFEYLACRIRDAIIGAITASREPGTTTARLTTANVHDLIDRGLIEPFARNRAVDPFLENGEEACTLLELPPTDCRESRRPSPDLARERAYNGDLDVLSIERAADGKVHRVGQLVFFGVHPTAMADHTAFYSSDFVGLAMRRLEVAAGSSGFISGFFNGSDGDVSPQWAREDAGDARALSKAFARAVVYASDSQNLAGDGRPTAVTRAVLDESSSIFVRRTSHTQRSFCKHALPLMGVATVGGAEDGRSFGFDDGWRAPSRTGVPLKEQDIIARLGLWRLFNDRTGQGKKQPGLDTTGQDLLSLTGLLAPPGDYPREVPMTFAMLGPVQFAAVPFEVTSVASIQIRKELGVESHPTILVGLANEYLSYVASEREYQLQDYEGASTLYGLESAQCVAAALKETMHAPAAGGVVPAADFDAGPGALFDLPLGPDYWGKNPRYSDQSLESPFVETVLPPRWARFEWTSELDARLSIWQDYSDGWRMVAADDDGDMLLELVDGTACMGTCKRGRGWSAVWLRIDPADTTPAIFVARTKQGSHCSDAFTLATIASPHGPPVLAEASCPASIGK